VEGKAAAEVGLWSCKIYLFIFLLAVPYHSPRPMLPYVSLAQRLISITNNEVQVGDGYCFHGDFVNGWLDEAQKNLLKATSRNQFMRVDGPRGQGKAGPSCKATDSDPQSGTSDYIESMRMLQML
jgi:hypothetical protein